VLDIFQDKLNNMCSAVYRKFAFVVVLLLLSLIHIMHLPGKDKQTILVAKLRLANKRHAAPMSGPPYGFLGNLNPSGMKHTCRDCKG